MENINKEFLEVIKKVETLIEKVSSMDDKISEIHEGMKGLIKEQAKLKVRVGILWKGVGIAAATISGIMILFFKKLAALMALVG